MSLKCALTGESQEFCDCSVEPSRTKQSFKDDADINVIVARFMKGEIRPEDVQAREAAFGDFSDGYTFFELHNQVIAAQEAFMTLPAEVRDRFGNDPAEILEFLSDEANRDEAVKLGIVSPKASPQANAAVVPSESPKEGGLKG